MKRQVYLIVVAGVVIGVLIAVWAVTAGGAAPHSSTVHPTTQPRAETVTAGDQLAGLQKQFSAAVQDRHRPPQSLVNQARDYVQTYPRDADGWTLLSQILAYRHQIKPAYEAICRAIKLAPGHAAMQAMAGTLAANLHQPKQAAHHFAQAVALDASNGRYRVLLASAQMELHEDDQARQSLLTALKLDSSLYQAHAALSSLFARQNKLGEALDQIQRAIQMMGDKNPSSKLIYIRRQAKLLRRANRPGDSLSVLEDLPLKQRLKPDVLKDMAASWAMLGQPAKAAANYEQARLFHPTSGQIAAEAVRWRLKAGQLDKARADLAKLRQIDPHFPAIPTLAQQITHG